MVNFNEVVAWNDAHGDGDDDMESLQADLSKFVEIHGRMPTSLNELLDMFQQDADGIPFYGHIDNVR